MTVGVPSPDLTPPMHVPAECWPPDRLEIRAWLYRIRPSLGEQYEGAVDILFRFRCAGYARIVAHAVREMGNQLPGAVSSDIIREHMEVTDQLDEILKKWKKFSLPLDGKIAISMTAADSDTAQPPGFLLSNELALLFAKLVTEHTKVW